MTHFIYYKKNLKGKSLTLDVFINKTIIKSFKNIKSLKVILNQKLYYIEYITHV